MKNLPEVAVSTEIGAKVLTYKREIGQSKFNNHQAFAIREIVQSCG